MIRDGSEIVKLRLWAITYREAFPLELSRYPCTGCDTPTVPQRKMRAAIFARPKLQRQKNKRNEKKKEK